MTKNRRLELQKILEDIVGNKVYFQPPESFRMSYPCLRYSVSGVNTSNADNKNYTKKRRYTLVYMDKDPDSEIPNKLLDLSYCSFSRSYTMNNLNHWVFDLYF